VPVGELEPLTVGTLDGEIRGLRDAGFTKIVLDLAKLSFIDSAGLRYLLELRERSGADGFALDLLPGPPPVQRMFEVTGTYELAFERTRSGPPPGGSAAGSH
jgi:anti-anti-sigma factor